MDAKLFKITCDPVCGFEVKSHDKQEVVSIAMSHASDKHKDLKITRDQTINMVKTG